MQASHIVHDMAFIGLFNPGTGIPPLVEGSHAVQVGVVHEEDWIISGQLQPIQTGCHCAEKLKTMCCTPIF